jgi:serine/threonine-protein kinase PpkA
MTTIRNTAPVASSQPDPDTVKLPVCADIPASWAHRAGIGLVFAAALLGLSALAPVDAQERVPLLMEGKRTLFQRVLTRPGATLARAPGQGGSAVAPFSVLYVYSRQSGDNGSWLEVGASDRGIVDGWIGADTAIDWKQTMVVAFTNPAGRNRLALYKSREFLLDLLESETAVKRNAEVVANLASALESGESSADLPAISIEPETYVDFTKDFYLLPILDAEEVFLADGFSARLLKIASVSATDGAPPASSSGGGGTSESAPPPPAPERRTFKTGIAFVVDTTASMGPYIDQMRSVMSRIYTAIDEAKQSERVAFSLVGFRDNIQSAPGLEYVSKVFVDFPDGAQANSFAALADNVTPSEVSSKSFNEDTYAGVLSALNDLNWDGFGGRYIVIITDAGPRNAADPLSSTGLSATGLRQLAADKGVAVLTLHLLTPEGKRNHELAAGRLSTLSAQPTGDLYYGVEAGDPEKLGSVIESIATTLTRQVALISDGEVSEGTLVENATKNAARDGQLSTLQSSIARAGYAMQLKYLGAAKGATIPPVFEAWVADRDVANPDLVALEVRVLLTKNQLSDLQEALKSIMYAGEVGQISPESFFDEIRSAAAALARDPDKVRKAEYQNLAETGLLSEYLEGLPYRSKVMNVTRDLWLSWSIGEQQAFLDEIEAKIRLYERFYDDVDRWTVLARSGGGDAVYPVPLDALP